MRTVLSRSGANGSSCRDSVLNRRSIGRGSEVERHRARVHLHFEGSRGSTHDDRDGARGRAMDPFRCARTASATCSPNAAALGSLHPAYLAACSASIRTTAATSASRGTETWNSKRRGVHDYTEMPAEQMLGAPLVGFDLRPQRVHVVEPALVAQPLHERQPHAPAVQVARVSQQMRLDGGVRSRRRSAGCRCWSARRARRRRSSSSSRTRRAAESARSSVTMFAVGNPIVCPRLRPSTIVPSTKYGWPSSAPASSMRASATSRRMRVLLTTKSL